MKKLIFCLSSLFLPFWLVVKAADITSLESTYENFASLNNHTIGVVVITYNRPDYLRKCVSGLETNQEAQFLPFFFIMDGGPGATQKENCEIIENAKIQHKYIIKRDINYGCARSLIGARRFMFETCGFERIIFIEDDLLVNPDYINVTLRLHDWAKANFDNIGIVSSFNVCFLDAGKKREKLNLVQENYDYYWGYCIDKIVYDDTKAFMNDLEKKFFIDFPKDKIKSRKLVAWLRKNLSLPRTPRMKRFPSYINYRNKFEHDLKWMQAHQPYRDGQDIEMRIALYQAGYIKISTKVNRARYIGKIGVHHKLNFWQRIGFGKMTLQRYSEDESLENFRW